MPDETHREQRERLNLRKTERKFFIDNLLVRIHFIIVMIRWTGLAPWEFEFPFPGSLTSTFLVGLSTFVERRGTSLRPRSHLASGLLDWGALCACHSTSDLPQGRNVKRFP